MDAVEAVKLLLDAPLTIVLLYLLVREQKDHSETRRERDNDNRTWIERYAGLADRVSQAVERLDLPGPP